MFELTEFNYFFLKAYLQEMASGVNSLERTPIHLQGTMLGHWGKTTWGNWGVGGSDRFVEVVMVGCSDWLVGSLLCVKKKNCGWGGRCLRANMCNAYLESLFFAKAFFMYTNTHTHHNVAN